MMRELSQLYNIVRGSNNRYRSRVYAQVYAELMVRIDLSLPRTEKELCKIRGIGPSIARDIMQWQQTGRIERLIQLRQQQQIQEQQTEQPAELGSVDPIQAEKDHILAMFESIHGVGPKTAQNWYEQGWRCWQDLVNNFSNLTDVQKIGLYYYKDLTNRIPRSEIDALLPVLQMCLPDVTWVICGSYRRQCTDSGDVDLLVQAGHLSMYEVYNRLVRADIIKANLSLGEKKYMGVAKWEGTTLNRRLDIRMIQPESWAFGTLYFTGSDRFNIMMRERAISLGWKLSEYSLSTPIGDVLIQTEQNIFAALGLEYKEPRDR